jgi:hypothetical protein
MTEFMEQIRKNYNKFVSFLDIYDCLFFNLAKLDTEHLMNMQICILKMNHAGHNFEKRILKKIAILKCILKS